MNPTRKNYKILHTVFDYGSILYQEGIQRHGESFEKAVENSRS